MNNTSASQFLILFKCISPYSKRCITRVVIAMCFLVGFCYVFHLCNQVPTKVLDLKVDTYGAEGYDMVIQTFLGKDSPVNKNLDSSYFYPFIGAKRSGVQLTISSEMIKDAAPLSRYYSKDVDEALGLLREAYPDEPAIDSLDTMVDIMWGARNYSNSFILFPKVRSRRMINRHTDDSTAFRVGKFNIGCNNYDRDGIAQLLYHNRGKTLGIKNIATYESSRFFYNSLLWALYDVSQSYVGIKLSGKIDCQKLYSDGISTGHSYDMSTPYNKIELCIDLGSPVSTSHMIPEPDILATTGIIFNDPEKIQSIIDNGLAFHVRFLQNNNFQSMKLFFLTTAISALLTYICTVIVQWISYKIRRKKERKAL